MTRASARIPRSVAWLVGLACILVLSVLVPASQGASSSGTTLGVDVPSAISLDTSGCASNSPGRTSFGNVVAGTTNLTSIPCTVQWNSSNDMSMLRMGRVNSTGSAMQLGDDLAGPVVTPPPSIGAIAPIDALDAYATFGDARVRKTSDGGASWSAGVVAPTVPFALAVWPSAPLVVLGVGSNGVIVRSADGGATWATPASGTTAQLRSVTFGSASAVWASGQNGTVLHSTDAGLTWAPQASGSSSLLIDVYAIDASTAVATSNGSYTTLSTADGGATWTTTYAGRPTSPSRPAAGTPPPS